MEILLGGKLLKYELIRKKIKNINLHIKPNGEIYVSAPKSTGTELIESFILSKEKNILRAIERFENEKKCAPVSKKLESGEEIYLFGEKKTLSVTQGKINRAALMGDAVIITVKDTYDYEMKKRALEGLLFSLFQNEISSIVLSVYSRLSSYRISFPTVRCRKMLSRWGSCQPRKAILTFNYALVKAPPSVIEYVVIHEFVHFLVPNHSKAFYESLEIFCPDWRTKKEILKGQSTELF